MNIKILSNLLNLIELAPHPLPLPTGERGRVRGHSVYFFLGCDTRK